MGLFLFSPNASTVLLIAVRFPTIFSAPRVSQWEKFIQVYDVIRYIYWSGTLVGLAISLPFARSSPSTLLSCPIIPSFGSIMMDAVQDMGMSTVSYPASLENEKRFTASLETLVPVRAKRLTFEQVTKVEKVTTMSFEGDPYHEYLQCSEDRRETWLFKTVISLSRTVFLYEHVRQKTGWTLDEGDALICYSDPAKPASRAYKIVNAAVQRLALFVLSKEQTKRFKESQDKLGAAVKELLEEHGEDMFSIDLLACTPAKQGRGYGTILGRFVTAEADSRALKTYVVSSNVNANTVFYNNLGFFTAKTIVLGDKNPKWRKPPVRLDVMVREVPSVSDEKAQVAML